MWDVFLGFYTTSLLQGLVISHSQKLRYLIPEIFQEGFYNSDIQGLEKNSAFYPFRQKYFGNLQTDKWRHKGNNYYDIPHSVLNPEQWPERLPEHCFLQKGRSSAGTGYNGFLNSWKRFPRFYDQNRFMPSYSSENNYPSMYKSFNTDKLLPEKFEYQAEQDKQLNSFDVNIRPPVGPNPERFMLYNGRQGCERMVQPINKHWGETNGHGILNNNMLSPCSNMEFTFAPHSFPIPQVYAQPPIANGNIFEPCLNQDLISKSARSGLRSDIENIFQRYPLSVFPESRDQSQIQYTQRFTCPNKQGKGDKTSVLQSVENTLKNNTAKVFQPVPLLRYLKSNSQAQQVPRRGSLISQFAGNDAGCGAVDIYQNTPCFVRSSNQEEAHPLSLNSPTKLVQGEGYYANCIIIPPHIYIINARPIRTVTKEQVPKDLYVLPKDPELFRSVVGKIPDNLFMNTDSKSKCTLGGNPYNDGVKMENNKPDTILKNTPRTTKYLSTSNQQGKEMKYFEDSKPPAAVTKAMFVSDRLHSTVIPSSITIISSKKTKKHVIPNILKRYREKKVTSTANSIKHKRKSAKSSTSKVKPKRQKLKYSKKPKIRIIHAKKTVGKRAKSSRKHDWKSSRKKITHKELQKTKREKAEMEKTSLKQLQRRNQQCKEGRKNRL